MGQKVRKEVKNLSVVTVTDYLSGFHYESNVLRFFATSEGYVSYDEQSEAFTYIYNYTDHLGNIRLSYTKGAGSSPPVIVEESHYYPFGLKHKKYGQAEPIPALAYQYKFQSQEYQDELNLNVYDYLARVYDPAVPRFWQIDPLAEKYHSQSTYVYAANNPVFFQEKNGQFPDPPEVLSAAQYFLGTMYEWGGKTPSSDLIGAYNTASVGAPGVSSSIDGRGTTKRELEQMSLNLKDYYYDGQGSTQAVYDEYGIAKGNSFGIDCSGLAATAFNSDSDKLMGNLVGGTAHNQRQQFANAEKNGTGLLHRNPNLIGMGDLVFYENSKGRVTHVMVATGQVQKDRNGNVTKFQIIHAPQSGGKVEYAWRSFQKGSHSIGHTYRKGEENNSGNMWQRVRKYFENFQNFTNEYQSE